MFYKILKEICEEEKIKITFLSYDWIVKLEKNNITKFIYGKSFNLNSSSVASILNDKYATYEILNNANIPVVKHNFLFNSNKFVLTNIDDILKLYPTKSVVKPNKGSRGYGVYKCSNNKELEAKIKELFLNFESVCVCPYYEIKREYRCFYLNGVIKLIYYKTKPYVIGSGLDDLYTLIKELKLPNNLITKENIDNLELNYIPKKDERIELSWKFNLSGGAKSTIVSNKKVENLALKAGAALNVTFATIDIIEEENNLLSVLEVNGGVCATHFIEQHNDKYDLIKEIYKEALNSLF